MFIEGKDLVKKYGKGEATVFALDHADFSMDKGEISVILGPSGSGKSTLLNILGGLDKATWQKCSDGHRCVLQRSVSLQDLSCGTVWTALCMTVLRVQLNTNIFTD